MVHFQLASQVSDGLGLLLEQQLPLSHHMLQDGSLLLLLQDFSFDVCQLHVDGPHDVLQFVRGLSVLVATAELVFQFI